ncbi:hypothetical protein ACFCYN_18455 [Gottfriedia sp. NPDC056225]|uniref:hypothetical protein n=1 Tax=Gottfriedia sp. NPDC056225 TaxID=3345751 RepID=UPI0015587423|nr:hypothetical protein HPK19_13485 [Arthrobacter citreus]
MEKKPIFYDGSNLVESTIQEDQIKTNVKNDETKVTDDMRKNISGNPYIFE